MDEVVTEVENIPAEELKILVDGGGNVGDGLVRMHEMIWVVSMGMKIPAGMMVGHIDGDPYNNRQANLCLYEKGSLN